jgi:hypothetical protein
MELVGCKKIFFENPNNLGMEPTFQTQLVRHHENVRHIACSV